MLQGFNHYKITSIHLEKIVVTKFIKWLGAAIAQWICLHLPLVAAPGLIPKHNIYAF